MSEERERYETAREAAFRRWLETPTEWQGGPTTWYGGYDAAATEVATLRARVERLEAALREWNAARLEHQRVWEGDDDEHVTEWHEAMSRTLSAYQAACERLAAFAASEEGAGA